MADVLVDTSVWIAFLRRAPAPWRSALVDLLERDVAVVVDPIVAELLYGARHEREQSVILDLARGLRRPALDLDVWVATGELGRTWRQRGRTLSVVDCLLAAVAQRNELLLWTLDEDFAPLATAGEVRRFAPPA